MTETLSMGQRRAGQATVEELLRHPGTRRTRSSIARFFGRSPLTPECVDRYRHALAQIAVGGALGRLGSEWTVISAVPATGGAPGVDHVIVGPGGVFTVRSALHEGDVVWVADTIFIVKGHTLDYIVQAEGQADRVSGLLRPSVELPVPVRPAVAVLGAKRITIRERPERVAVLDADDLLAELLAAPVVLGPIELRAILEVLDDPASWNGADAAAANAHDRPATDRLMADFAALQADVHRSASIRTGWKLAAYAVAVIGPLVAFPYIVDLVGALTGR